MMDALIAIFHVLNIALIVNSEFAMIVIKVGIYNLMEHVNLNVEI